MEDDQNVGPRLARLRQLFGISQRELARRAGVTNGTISGIESSKTSPQIGSLRKILEAFPITIVEFFSMDLQDTEQLFFRRAELVEMGGAGLSLRVVAAQKKTRSLQVTHEHYAPSADTGVHMLSHHGEEAGIVIRGTLEVYLGSQMAVLQAGDAYYFPSSLPHRFRNPGTEECEVVSAATPPSF